MSGLAVAVRPVAGASDLDRFIRLPWRVYRDDPLWVPPLIADVRSALDRKHPFHRHADVEPFLAWRGGECVGRIAAIVNRAHNEFHQDQVGFFGLFECLDDDAEVALALLGAAESWLAERGRTAALGPLNLSTNDELHSPGVLIDGFDTPPAIMMGHTRRSYPALLEGAGYAGAKDLVCYWIERPEATPEKVARALERSRELEGLVVRPMDMKHFARDVTVIEDVYNSAWERNWGFVPMTPAEMAYMARHLRSAIRPELCLLAFRNGEPVAFALGLPDYNQALRHLDGRLLPLGVFKLLYHRRHINSLRVLTLGVKPDCRQGSVGAILMARLFDAGVRMGMIGGECSWILEDNLPMRRGLEQIGGRVYKTYRIYGKTLTG